MQLEDILGKVRVQKPLAWKNLQVFPLVQPNGHEPGYAILDDLLDRAQVEVTEINDGGHVPTVKVLNKADINTLILDGTELHGAKQNRMVNVTVVVGKGTETEIPVSCVEQGRWAYRARVRLGQAHGRPPLTLGKGDDGERKPGSRYRTAY